MSFRRKRDESADFLKKHGPELRACGVPDFITRDRMRFFSFLEHGGFDESGWYETKPSTAWSIAFLTSDKAGRLAEFIVRHFGEEQYRFLLRGLRQRVLSEPEA